MLLDTLLRKLGFQKSEIGKIKSSYSLRKYTEKKLVKRIYLAYMFILSLGYSPKETCTIIAKCPSAGGYSTNTLSRKIENLANLGFSAKEISKLIKSNPKILSYSTTTVKDKFDFFLSIGMPKAKVIKMVAHHPKILSYSIDQYKSTIKFLYDLKLDFTKEDIIEILVFTPQITALDQNNIQSKVDMLKSKNFTPQEIRSMIVNYPNFLGQDSNKLSRKIDIYIELGIINLIIKDSKRLMQSLELTVARVRFLQDKVFKGDKKNYHRIFKSQDIFKKMYQIDSETLKLLYAEEIKKYTL